MAKSPIFETLTAKKAWDGTMEPVKAKSGKPVTIVLVRDKLSPNAAANQAETNKRAAESGAPFVDT